MMKTFFVTILIMLIFGQIAVRADVAPDRGFTRKSVSLNLEIDPTIKDYRFFLVSPASVDEIKFTNENTVEISAANRGGAARYARLYAFKTGEVPPGLVDGAKGNFNNAVLSDNNKLLSHSFIADVPTSDADDWADPIYRIEYGDDQKLNAVLIAGGSGIKQEGGHTDTFGVSSAGRKLLPYAIAGIAASIFLAAGLATIGIMLIKRSRRKNED